MDIDNAPDQRKTDASSLAICIQFMKDAKYSISKTRLDPDAIVADVKSRDALWLISLTDLYPWFGLFPQVAQVGMLTKPVPVPRQGKVMGAGKV